VEASDKAYTQAARLCRTIVTDSPDLLREDRCGMDNERTRCKRILAVEIDQLLNEADPVRERAGASRPTQREAAQHEEMNLKFWPCDPMW
jgi:hypothetical protein